jgi:hypothetical protein
MDNGPGNHRSLPPVMDRTISAICESNRGIAKNYWTNKFIDTNLRHIPD